MIASLKGKIELLGTDWAVVNVGGVGYKVFVSTATLSQIQNISEVKLFTYLQVREDALSLFGFTTFEELGIFETMLSVSGIGPKLALALLSSFKADELAIIIATGNEAMLCTVSGIGKKTASRIVLELKDKVARSWAVTPLTAGAADSEVMAALGALGYSATEAAKAVVSIPKDPAMSLEDKIKYALAGLSKT
ncbi:Holliday junction branch migration protein RuvA [Dehalogenimonas etheniformans]|uniref:Holliday junction branch migration complex subunit RuvA n=1 Tax=Dehalogenimonas etheniformans TaxID=1536648 RepID=A0A2P5P8X3_9CHLR|nr:Holliday junction branch migration protein RuvA [Dehalogenimonas etheniformans]PPD58748.1 Holliday junction branch migration protein RuvA [Dehalogenimonas etheniformans]QNT76482.1 Holliday junction branch migration protein RuvA [Dehalogenimonas etheniformans]